jgi:hypothetical protein
MKNAGVHGVQFGAALSDHAEPHLIDFDADPMVGISPIQGSAYARSKGASPSFENQYAAAVGIVYIVIAVIVIRRLEQVGIVVLVLFWLLLLLLLLSLEKIAQARSLEKAPPRRSPPRRWRKRAVLCRLWTGTAASEASVGSQVKDEREAAVGADDR